MEGSKKSDSRSVNEDRLYLLETILPGIAHEINNHSQTILLSGQVLLEVWEGLKRVTDQYFEQHGEFSAGGLDYSMFRDELSGYYSNILHGAQQIEQTVSALRAFGQQDPRADHGSVDLNHLLEGTLRLLANSIRKNTDNLQLNLDPELPKIHGSGRSIKQVLLHLISNACRSIHDKKQGVEISTHYDESEETVRCEISHRGTVIPQEVLSQIRGFLSGAGPYPAESYPGLAAVRSIMSVHDGEVEIKSEAGKGTRVTLNFPVRSEGDKLGKT